MREKLRALGTALAVPLAYMLIQQLVVSLCCNLYIASWVKTRGANDQEALQSALAAYRMQNGLLFLLAAALLGIVLALFLIRRAPAADAAALFRVPDGPSAGLLILLGLSANLLIGFLLERAPFPQELLEDYGRLTEMLAGQGLALNFAVACLVVPLAEELIFRGVAYRALRRAFPASLAILIQALLFAAFHGNLIQIAGVFPMAIALGLVYEWSGTLASPILLHIVFNCANAVVLLLPGLSAPAGAIAWLGLAAVGVVAGVRGLHRRRVARDW